jgi:hypothetical protein
VFGLALLLCNKGLRCQNYQDYEQLQDMTVNATETASMNNDASAKVCPDPGCQLEQEESWNMNQESLLPDIDLKELSNLANLEDIKIAMLIIQDLEKASLDGSHSHLDDNTLTHL